MRGEDKCRYLCADKEEDMLKIFAWIVKAKVCSSICTCVYNIQCTYVVVSVWLVSEVINVHMWQYPDQLQTPILPTRPPPPTQPPVVS